jgi:hypothetical protein
MDAVSDTDKLPPNARMVRTDQHAHGRDSTRHACGIFARTPEHQSVGASGSADGKHSFSTTRRSITGPIWCAARECSRHDRFGSRTAQLRARWSSCFAQPSAVRLRWTQRCARGAGASSGCYVDVAWASMDDVSDTDKLPPNARMVRTDQHAHGRDSTHCGVWTLTMTPEHQSVGASGSAD